MNNIINMIEEREREKAHHEAMKESLLKAFMKVQSMGPCPTVYDDNGDIVDFQDDSWVYYLHCYFDNLPEIQWLYKQ